MKTSPAGSGPRRALAAGIGLFVFSALAVLIALLLLPAACTPLVRTIALPRVAPPAPLAPGSPKPCDLPDVDDQILEATWAYVHEHYPAQPWPDEVHLPPNWTVVVAAQRYLTHVVLCSHATGFVWEGEVAWRVRCTCCRVDVEGIRESFVVIAAPAATSTPRPPGDAPSP